MGGGGLEITSFKIVINLLWTLHINLWKESEWIKSANYLLSFNCFIFANTKRKELTACQNINKCMNCDVPDSQQTNLSVLPPSYCLLCSTSHFWTKRKKNISDFLSINVLFIFWNFYLHIGIKSKWWSKWIIK